jgi:voltage-gated potassium channel
MSISVYLLFGLTWSFLYDVIYQLQPHAFAFNGTASPLVSPGEKVFPVLAYFSFVTLTTIGYGDITPLTLQARYAAIAEGVTGQFYLAILVARLVSMLLAQSPTPSVSDTSSSSSGEAVRREEA